MEFLEGAVNTNSANRSNGRAGGPELNGSPLYDAAFIPNPQDVDWGPGPVSSAGLDPNDVVQHQLYFGLRRRDGSVVAEAGWKEFEETNLPATFPLGYKVVDGSGGWPEPEGGFLREPSKLVIANVGANQRLVGATAAALALVWKTQADQASVLWVRFSALAVNL